MKRRNIIIWLTFIFILAMPTLYIYYKLPKYDKNNASVQEYVAGAPGIKGNVNMTKYGDNPAYAMGANKDGYAVFKKPDKAFDQMKIDFAKGISAIQKEFKLLPLTRWNYEMYGAYGSQLTKSKDDESVSQAFRVAQFFDIYENSFKD